jgi:Cu2+-containing amine oxidase
MPAAYGGNDLSQANTVYLDSHWGIGASVRELVQGVDCPMTAAYIDAVTFFKGASKPNLHKNAICVFEHNPGRLTERHGTKAQRASARLVALMMPASTTTWFCCIPQQPHSAFAAVTCSRK